MHRFKIIPAMPLLFCLLAVAGCAPRSTVLTLTQKHSPNYLLQHSGVLSIAEKRIALRGIIKLNPAQRNARVVIMNDMGMKLLVAEIIADGYRRYESHKIFASPFLRMIPSFYAESMHCIYEMFLAPNPGTSALEITTKGFKQIEPEIRGPYYHQRLTIQLHSGTFPYIRLRKGFLTMDLSMHISNSGSSLEKTATGYSRSYLFKESFPGFDGHFPGNPILPGVIQTMLGQISALEALAIEYPADNPVLQSVTRCKFLRPVKPMEKLELNVSLKTKALNHIAICSLSVAGEPAATYQLIFTTKGM